MARPRDPTQFTRESAERIANVVRAAELATPGARPLDFERVDFSRSRVFRVATYTGAWSINASKTVTFKYQTATPNTATVLNLFFPVTSTAAGSRDCAIAKNGTAWFLIDVPLVTATAMLVGSTTTGISVAGITSTAVLTDITLSASLNTSACTISIGKTLVTASRIFVTGTAPAVFVASTTTVTYLRLG